MPEPLHNLPAILAGLQVVAVTQCPLTEVPIYHYEQHLHGSSYLCGFSPQGPADFASSVLPDAKCGVQLDQQSRATRGVADMAHSAAPALYAITALDVHEGERQVHEGRWISLTDLRRELRDQDR